MDDEQTVGTLFSLAGKTAVVIGASGAIGGAVARGFATAGADLALVFNSNRTAAERLAGGVREMGRRAEVYQVDVRLDSEVAENAECVAREFGRMDVLFNCAGGNNKNAMTDRSRGFFDLVPEAISDTLDLNFMGATVLPCLRYGKLMVGNGAGGSIINVCSMNSFRPLEGRPAYAASKAAVSNFTQWLACHIAKQYTAKVRVNAIAPGFFPNERMRSTLLEADGSYSERGRRIVDLTPMGRLGDVQDLVGTALWYASDASAFVTGTVTPVDGGFNAYAGV